MHEMTDDAYPERAAGETAATGGAVEAVPAESIPGSADSSGVSQRSAEPAQPERRTLGKTRLIAFVGRLRGMFPTVLVLGALAGLGYFGHHHGWTIPKFSELTGEDSTGGVQW